MKKCRAFVITTFVVITSTKLYVILNANSKGQTHVLKDGYKDSLPIPLFFDLNLNNTGSADNGMENRNSNFSTSEISEGIDGNPEVLSRKKRYILFPDGSTFTVST